MGNTLPLAGKVFPSLVFGRANVPFKVFMARILMWGIPKSLSVLVNVLKICLYEKAIKNDVGKQETLLRVLYVFLLGAAP